MTTAKRLAIGSHPSNIAFTRSPDADLLYGRVVSPLSLLRRGGVLPVLGIPKRRRISRRDGFMILRHGCRVQSLHVNASSGKSVDSTKFSERTAPALRKTSTSSIVMFIAVAARNMQTLKRSPLPSRRSLPRRDWPKEQCPPPRREERRIT